MSLKDRAEALDSIGREFMLLPRPKTVNLFDYDPPTPNTGTYIPNWWLADDDTMPIEIDLKSSREIDRAIDDVMGWLKPVCTCGSAKTYGATSTPELHSSWCDVRK